MLGVRAGSLSEGNWLSRLPAPSLTQVVTVAGLLVLFVLLAFQVRQGATEYLDDSVQTQVRAVASRGMYRLGRTLSSLGRVEVELPALIVGAVLLARAGRPRVAAALVFLPLATIGVEIVFKQLLLVPTGEVSAILGAPLGALPGRLLALLIAVPEAGFPSGHMARGTFLLGLLIGWVHLQRSPLLRLAGTLGPLLLLSLMAFTRVLLNNEHTLAEVVGGMLLGLAALAAFPIIAHSRPSG